MGTLSKTLAASGGYIAGSTALVELLKFISPGFVYSVGMSPPVAGAALAALRVIEREPERVTKLHENGQMFVDVAKSAGFDTGLSEGYSIVPVIIGDSLRTVKLTERLLERDINVTPIIYPAVPMKSGRLRFFLTCEHTQEHIHTAIKVMREELDRLTDENFSIEAAASALMKE
jgi:7-keto-8-aminopelargonate synthetase-like enzyme